MLQAESVWTEIDMLYQVSVLFSKQLNNRTTSYCYEKQRIIKFLLFAIFIFNHVYYVVVIGKYNNNALYKDFCYKTTVIYKLQIHIYF